MITPQQIPDEVVEAADEVHANFKGTFKEAMRASIAAALNSWPGARMEHPLVDWTGNLILPLTQEPRDGA